jgi:hypothetical protein
MKNGWLSISDAEVPWAMGAMIAVGLVAYLMYYGI